jgi:BirA family biotin operon repressor/biotin-[acetyl-CoA-carboxylase] ligase
MASPAAGPETVGEPEVDPAESGALAGCLPGAPLGGPLLAFARLDSTQETCRRRAEAGAPEGLVVVAGHQARGRGSRGRSWTAPPGAGLLFSVLLRPTRPAAEWSTLTLVGALAVAEGLEAVTGLAPQLKWPNDVLLDDRKVAGLLAEARHGGHPHVVLGVGINLTQSRADFDPGLADRATSLALAGGPAPRGAVLAAVLASLAARYRDWLARGFAALREPWRARGSLLEDA